MADLWISLALIFLLFFIGALFSAAEMALVSLRDSQIAKLAFRGKRGKAIERLTANPNRFLSAVQIGVTLAGFLSSAFGADSLANKYLAPQLASWGVPGANALAVVIVTAIISFLSIVLSELTAKRLAMQRSEEFALALAPMVDFIARLMAPLIWLLGKCTNVMVRILGGDPEAGKETVSEEELRSMVANSEILGAEERQIVDEVFAAGNSSLREVMVPRTEVDFISGDTPAYAAVRQVQENSHSRYPVTDGSPDRVLGFLHVRDLMNLDYDERQLPVKQLVRPVMSLPETVKVLFAMNQMRREGAHLAMVVDEYGGTAGIVTLEDLLEELIGEISDEFDVDEPGLAEHKELRDIAGLTSLEDFEESSGYRLPEGPYDTVAGYFLAELGRIPEVGDCVVVDFYRAGPAEEDEKVGIPVQLTVSEMDGRRISWLHAQRLDQPMSTVAPDEPEPQPDANAATQLQSAEARAGWAIAQHEDDLAKPGI